MSEDVIQYELDLEGDCVRVIENNHEKGNNMNEPLVGFQDNSGKIVGHLHCVLKDEVTGEIKQEFDIENLVVTTGKTWLAKRLAAESVNEMTHMAVGTSSTSPSAGDTALIGTELGRVAFDSKNRSANAVTMIATFPAGTATGTLNEAGIFDGSSGTTMLSRVAFAGPVTKGASDSFQVTWTVTMT